MDPVTSYQLGQIRQQELIEEAARDRRGEVAGLERVVIVGWQRLGAVLSKVFASSSVTPTQPATTPERAAQPIIANSR
jgi:hypothetical protein